MKDMERTFCELKRHWQVLAFGALSYEVKRLQHIMAHIQPSIECCHDYLFDEPDEDLDMFVESEDSNNDDEKDVNENDDDDDDDDDSE
ncbi:unnamed protein product [Lactuca saligna]|uniref:Uncharacterized protein n=1 Tax=Lactuca saligna TaxID=75948 RepID=A0AA35W0T4_LACSI|nr:unnamed protein product [Lactuca saligna]